MYKSKVKLAALAVVSVLVTPLGLLAQSIPDRQTGLKGFRLEPPVRVVHGKQGAASLESADRFLRVQYVEPGGPSSVGGEMRLSETAIPVAVGGEPMNRPHPHQVIRGPRIIQPGHSQPHADRHQPPTGNPVHPLPHLIRHHADQPLPAVIPDASHREVWKSPFSYGYFGASGARTWIRHYGYRDRDKEWRLR